MIITFPLIHGLRRPLISIC